MHTQAQILKTKNAWEDESPRTWGMFDRIDRLIC